MPVARLLVFLVRSCCAGFAVMHGRGGHEGEQTTEALTRPERVALLDITYGARPYVWRQSSMLKLEARGLVRRTGVTYGGKPGWEITPEGRGALEVEGG